MLHGIAFAPESCLGGGFLTAPWDDVAVAMQVSVYSLQALAVATLPLMQEHGGAVVGLDFDNTTRPGPSTTGWAWPKAALGATSRYLARDLGAHRCGSTSSPPGRSARSQPRASPASKSSRRSGRSGRPLGWDVRDREPVAKACVALLSDWFPATTGEIVHVDGGFHAVGA